MIVLFEYWKKNEFWFIQSNNENIAGTKKRAPRVIFITLCFNDPDKSAGERI